MAQIMWLVSKSLHPRVQSKNVHSQLGATEENINIEHSNVHNLLKYHHHHHHHYNYTLLLLLLLQCTGIIHQQIPYNFAYMQLYKNIKETIVTVTCHTSLLKSLVLTPTLISHHYIPITTCTCTLASDWYDQLFRSLSLPLIIITCLG